MIVEAPYEQNVVWETGGPVLHVIRGVRVEVQTPVRAVVWEKFVPSRSVWGGTRHLFGLRLRLARAQARRVNRSLCGASPNTETKP